MPDEMRQQGGYLWDTSVPTHKIIPCRLEEQFFAALGIKKNIPAPEQRTEALAKSLWGSVAP